MKIFITKYATTMGIVEIEGKTDTHEPDRYVHGKLKAFMNGSELFRLGKDAFLSIEEARRDAARRFDDAVSKATKALQRANEAKQRFDAGDLQVHDLSTPEAQGLDRNAASDAWAACVAFPVVPKPRKGKKVA